MTKSQALNDFFNGFSIPAYPSTRVPNGVQFPYLTYEPTLSNGGKMTNPRVCIWYYGDSEKAINDKAEEIMKAIGLGKSIRTDDGSIYVYMTGQWQALADLASEKITGRFTNLSIIFNTL